MGKEPRIRRSIEVKLLVDRGMKTRTGEVIPYSELEKVAGRSVRSGSPGYSSMSIARRKMEEMGVFFAAVSDDYLNGSIREGGLRRLSDSEVIDQQVTSDLNKVKSSAARVHRRCTSVNYDKLSDEHKVAHNTYTTLALATLHINAPGTQEKIEEKVKTGMAPIPTREVLVLLP